MTENLVPDELTPIAPAPLYAALRAAAPAAIGGELPRASALLLLAQIAEETGWRSCHCHNLGNLKHFAGDGHDYCEFRASEIVNGKEVFSVMQFRAYASLADGCVDYLALLHRRFAGAWTFVEGGDPHGFVKALAAEHYFTASEELYERSVTALDAQLAKEVPDDPPVPASSIVDLIRASITQSLDEHPPEDDTTPPAAA